MTTATEPVPEVAEPEVQPEVTAPEVETPEVVTPKAFDPEALPSEIKSYVEKQKEEISKKYADYDRHREASQQWEGVRNDPRFQAWAKSLNQPEKPQPFEISDEQFANALNDKGQFLALVQQAAERLVSERVGPQLDQVKQQHEFQQKITEIQDTVKKYPDFKQLDKEGKIEPYIRKYEGRISFEDAYWLAKKDTFNAEADRRARGIVEGKKAASIAKPGPAAGARGTKVNARNREEAMTMVMEAVRAGRPVPEFDEIGD